MPDYARQSLQQGAVTPGRTTSISFDVPDSVAQESVFSLHREADQLHPTTKTNVKTLAGGLIILKPVNDMEVSPEDSAAQSYQLRLSHFTAASIVTEIPRQRQYTELPDIGYYASVSVQGDYYFTKRIPASSTSWNYSVISPGPGDAVTVLGNTNVPLDRMMSSVNSHDSDTGYLLRLIFPGSYLQNPDYIFGFEFGGDLVGSGVHTGFGHYWLALTGDGRAVLYEHVDNAWTIVNRWRYNSPRDMNSAAVAIQITPYAPRHIEFQTVTLGAHHNLVGLAAEIAYDNMKAHQKDTSAVGAFVHTNANRAESTLPGGKLLTVTGVGRIACDVRRDIKMLWQVSRLGYPASGQIVDANMTLPYGVTGAHVARVLPIGYNYNPDGTGVKTALSATLENADGSALSTGTESFTWRGTTTTLSGYIPPGGENKLRARLTLTNTETAGSRFHTPVLLGYDVSRNGHPGTLASTPVSGGRAQQVSISGPSYEPDHETAHIIIEDDLNQLAFLRQRGQATVRIETTYDPTDPSLRCILFEGYTGRVNAFRKGKNGFIYPHAQWRRLEIDCGGKWLRFQNRFFMQRQDVSKDVSSPAGPTGDFQPWRVTDIIRAALAYEGYGDDQLDIPDDDIRIFISPHGGADNFSIPPGTSIPDLCVFLAVNYLNAFFLWDANARPSGATTQGMWRLLRPPDGTETPLWTFTTGTVTSGRLAHRGASFSPTTSVIYGDPYEFKSYIQPPEGNVLTVSGADVRVPGGGWAQLRRQLVNPTSFDSPTHSTADTNSIDYLGRIVPIEYVDPTIGHDGDLAKAQATLDFIARRIFNIACRGRKWFEFVSDLAIVEDTAPLADGGAAYTNPTYPRRLLRPGDLVLIDGETCIIHACNPIWSHDVIQLMHVEAELFRAENTFGRN